jgi:hypothetical protein
MKKTQDALKNEINNLALKICEERSALQNSTYSDNIASWRVPETEVLNRTF